MRQLGSMLIAMALGVATACSNESTLGPTAASTSTGGAAPAPPPPSVPGPPYTVAGRVTDSRGNPVAGAEIWIYGNDSPIDNRYGVTFADSSGRYTVTSATRVPHTVRAMKDGYVRRDVPVNGSASSSVWTTDVTIAHIDRYVLLAPSAVGIGEWSRIQARIDLDDASTSEGFLFMELSSDRPSVLRMEPTGWITGVSSGTATITARYYGATATALVRVNGN